MKCREVAEFLVDYTSGELPQDTREIFERHLSRCGNCHEYLSQYRYTVECERRAFGANDALPGDVPEELVQAILKARRETLK